MEAKPSLSFDADILTLCWDNGACSHYHSLWLLDNAPQHRDAHSGQRLIDICDLPSHPKLSSAKFEDGSIIVTWRDHPETARFPTAWLRQHDPERPWFKETNISFWPLSGARAQAADFCWSTFDEICGQSGARRRWLGRLRRDGLVFVRGIPASSGAVLELAQLAGIVYETNYGRVFDVRSTVKPTNLADSDRALGLHTDNPYREPIPGFQLLHVLECAPAGGESLFADGFRIANYLREHYPDYFRKLTATPLRFAWSSSDASFEAWRSLIELSPGGELAAVRYNNRSISPLQIAGGEIRELYSAYREFACLLRDPGFQLRIPLQKGEAVLFDNWRVLHGRTAYSQRHARHLQGCYLTRDSVQSNIELGENQ